MRSIPGIEGRKEPRSEGTLGKATKTRKSRTVGVLKDRLAKKLPYNPQHSSHGCRREANARQALGGGARKRYHGIGIVSRPGYRSRGGRARVSTATAWPIAPIPMVATLLLEASATPGEGRQRASAQELACLRAGT